jgi:hypothetical protein
MLTICGVAGGRVSLFVELAITFSASARDCRGDDSTAESAESEATGVFAS